MAMEWGAVGAWVVVTAGVTLAGAPLAAAVFDRLPCRGGAFALPVSLVVIGLVSFWVGHLRYGWVALLAGLAVLGGLSGAALATGVRPSPIGVVEGYLVFLAGAALALAVRLPNATITPIGGEEFLHVGLLNAVERAGQLPPEDMWFAGESVSYYYGGHVLVDQLARLAGTEVRLAYGLGFIVIFGMVASTAYGLVGAVVEAYGYRRRVGGLLGAAVVLGAGTLATPARLLFAQLPADVAVRYGRYAYAAIPSTDPIESVIADYSTISGWSYWYERRVVDGMLVETPLFSLVKGDLHGHVTTIPFMILLIALAFAYHRTPAGARTRRLALVLVAFPAAAALVGWMNTWSLPGAVGIAWLALALAPAHPLSLAGARFEPELEVTDGIAGVTAELTRLGAATAGAVVVGVLGAAAIAPFVLFQLPTNDGVGLVADRSPLGSHLLLFGAFFAAIALFLWVALWQRYAGDERPRRAVSIALAVVLGAVVLGAAGLASLAIAAPLLVLAWWLVRRPPSIGFIGLLVAGTLGLILVMELVHADVWPPERERLNTTYKLSMQAMVFGLLALSAIATALVSDRLPTSGWRPTFASAGVVVVIVAIMLALAVFPALVLGGELTTLADRSTDEWTIDGLASHERDDPAFMEAVAFIDEREGTPTLLEAPGEDTYTFANPASTFTGVPTVLGWAHQQGYRGVDTYEDRLTEVDTMFTGDEATVLELLDVHDVEYVWVGTNERTRYGSDIVDFEALEGVTVAVENQAATIYAVED